MGVEVSRSMDAINEASQKKRDLQEYADTLQREIQQIEEEWKASCEPIVRHVINSDGLVTDVSALKAHKDILPVQVNGQRWYCSSRPAIKDGVRRYVGPLRPAFVQA